MKFLCCSCLIYFSNASHPRLPKTLCEKKAKRPTSELVEDQGKFHINDNNIYQWNIFNGIFFTKVNNLYKILTINHITLLLYKNMNSLLCFNRIVGEKLCIKIFCVFIYINLLTLMLLMTSTLYHGQITRRMVFRLSSSFNLFFL